MIEKAFTEANKKNFLGSWESKFTVVGKWNKIFSSTWIVRVELWLNVSVCSYKQKWNQDENQCLCKESDDCNSCKDDYKWNPSNCDCECNKACNIGKNLGIKFFWFNKRLTRKFVLDVKM